VLQDVECTVIVLDLIAWTRLKFSQEYYGLAYGVQRYTSVGVYPVQPLDKVANIEVEQEDEGYYSVGPRFGKGC